MTDDSNTLSDRSRRKKEREQEKIRARKALRATYDLPPELRQRIKTLAEEQGVPASQLVTLALLRFLQDYARNEIPMGNYKQPSRSPRYDWNLVFPDSLNAVVKRSAKAGKKERKG